MKKTERKRKNWNKPEVKSLSVKKVTAGGRTVSRHENKKHWNMNDPPGS